MEAERSQSRLAQTASDCSPLLWIIPAAVIGFVALGMASRTLGKFIGEMTQHGAAFVFGAGVMMALIASRLRDHRQRQACVRAGYAVFILAGVYVAAGGGDI